MGNPLRVPISIDGRDRSRDVVAQKWPKTADAQRILAENDQIGQRPPASHGAFCVARSVLQVHGV